MTAMLRRRRLTGTGVELTEIGFGASVIGNLHRETSPDDAAAAVAAAWSAGIRYFDTAPHYGLGLSERRLGAALSGYPRDTFVVSSKVGRLLVDNPAPRGVDSEGFAVPDTVRRKWDFSRDGVLRSIDASLARTGLDRLDLVYLHDPDDHWRQAADEAMPALADLRDQGVIGAIGAGMNQSAMLTRFVTDTDVDVVLVAGRYTLLDRSAGQDLLPAAQRQGVSVLAGGVFNSGLLAAPDRAGTYDYQPAPPALIARARELQAACERFGVPLRAAAARFPARHPAVAGVLIGARSPAEITDAIAWWAAEIPAGLWDALDAEQP